MLRRLCLLLALALSTSACKEGSTRPSIPPTAPEVRCKQGDTPPIGKAPREDEWIDRAGRVSEALLNWIDSILGTVRKERELRKIEHACLDQHEARGDIRQ
jgi:hypothetical protein